MTAAARPLPSLADPVCAPFWSACREGRLEVQRCVACGQIRWPPARRCPHCLEASTTIVVLRGRGTVWSHARYLRALHPAFAESIPYVVLAVALDEGPVMIAGLHGSDEGLAIGAPVAAVFTAITDDVTLPQFELRRD